MKQAKLAWVTAQIHCQCSVSENRIILPSDPGQMSSNDLTKVSSDTSFVPFKGLISFTGSSLENVSESDCYILTIEL